MFSTAKECLNYCLPASSERKCNVENAVLSHMELSKNEVEQNNMNWFAIYFGQALALL